MRRLRLRSKRGLSQLYNRVVTRPSTGGEIFGIVFGGIFAVVGFLPLALFCLPLPVRARKTLGWEF
jgi:hypothetical protein